MSASPTSTEQSQDAVITGESPYVAPTEDIRLALDVAGIDDLLALPHFAGIDRDSVDFAVEEFGRFAGEVIAPTDRVGDLEGSHLQADGTVRTPTGFKEAFASYAEAGWGAIQFPTDVGGGGLPSLVGLAVQEMLMAANMSFSLNPILTQSAIELLLAWGSEEQRGRYLEKLVTGEWTGTMNLTEPEAGSDLGEVITTATQDAEGHWRVSGTKIYITWGDHDLTENVIHLVLARIPGGPPGTKGLSLFIVPKVLVTEDGALGQPNSLRALRLEEKMGIHASPTCVMEFDQAIGELVGEEHSGMRSMFTMMNAARLSVGMQGAAVADRAYQQARIYASVRKQGRAEGVRPPASSAIIDHPDVARMLISMKTLGQAARQLIFAATAQRDLAEHATTEEARVTAQGRVDLLTPIAKAWSTDAGVTAASTGIQVFGGIGFVEESGISQRLRDIRIAPIYEGTNGIQAIDLVLRKLPSAGGAHITALLDEIDATVAAAKAGTALGESYTILGEAAAAARHAATTLISWIGERTQDVLAGATVFQELLGLTITGWLMVQRAELALERDVELGCRVAGECIFFTSEHTARATGLLRPVLAGAGRLQGIA